MARHRLPNETNVLTGAWAKNPDRVRPPTAQDDEPISEAPPALELISFEQAWAAVLEMAAPGVLRRRDEGAVAEVARLHMVIRNTLVFAIRAGRIPEVDNSTATQYRNWLAKLGCTPVDSHHVAAPAGVKGKGAFD